MNCVTCGHHKRDHDKPGGCQRCTDIAEHQFLSPEAADSMLAEHPDLLAPSVRLQARLYALEQAHKTYDLVTEALDDPPPYTEIIVWAREYAEFLLS